MFFSESSAETSTPTIPGNFDTGDSLKLFRDIGIKIAAASQLPELIEEITQMTQHTLSAGASSLLLLDEQKNELFFEVAIGEVGKQLRRVTLSARSGIAGWVAQRGKPIIVNDVSKDKRFENAVDAATGFVTRSIMCAPLVLHRKTIGVIEVLNKLDGGNFTGNDLEVLTAVCGTAAIAIENARLHENVIKGYKDTIKALAAAIEAKDPHTCGHSKHVTNYALLMGETLALPREDIEMLEYAGILHDVGKIGIDESILTNARPLTAEEWDIIREHPVIGANILKEIPFLEKARELVLYHHERYDGTGYPSGLKGEDIPLGARLLAVADSYEAMTASRPYRIIPLTTAEALGELADNKGTQFDPYLVDLFYDTITRRK